MDLLLAEIRSRLACLVDVGLGYLALDRQARTLSGGEVQRVNLTAAIGTNLVGALFVLDEPSVGLHPRDNDRLVRMLRRLCDQGNTVVVVEHDPVILAAADHVIDLGPGAGEGGGRGGRAGHARRAEAVADLAHRGLSRRAPVRRGARRPRRSDGPDDRRARRARAQPAGRGPHVPPRASSPCSRASPAAASPASRATCSTARSRARSDGPRGRPDRMPACSASSTCGTWCSSTRARSAGAAGRTPPRTSAPGTGSGPSSDDPRPREARGFDASAFSFNVAGGRCERCQGEGVERVEMQFLSDVEVTCPGLPWARGSGPRSARCEVDGLSIDDVLRLTAAEALAHFAPHRRVVARARSARGGGTRLPAPGAGAHHPLERRGPAPAARSRPDRRARRTSASLYVFDEPTTGLHLEDVAVLLRALRRLADAGHAVLVVEHHVDVMRAADRFVDLGPEGGAEGGASWPHGTPAEVARGDGHTARYLREALAGPRMPRVASRRERRVRRAAAMQVRGAREHNLRGSTSTCPAPPSWSSRAERLRQVDAGLRHRVRRRAAPLHRDPVRVRPPVRRPARASRRRPRRGHPADRRHRTAPHARRPALDRGHHHGGRPLPAPALRARRRAALPDLRPRAQGPAARDAPRPHPRGTPRRGAGPLRAGRPGTQGLPPRAARAAGEEGPRARPRRRCGDAARPHARSSPATRSTTSRSRSRAWSSGRGPRRRRSRSRSTTPSRVGAGNLVLVRPDGAARALSIHRTCPRDGTTVPEPDPRFFSHNSRRGLVPRLPRPGCPSERRSGAAARRRGPVAQGGARSRRCWPTTGCTPPSCARPRARSA